MKIRPGSQVSSREPEGDWSRLRLGVSSRHSGPSINLKDVLKFLSDMEQKEGEEDFILASSQLVEPELIIFFNGLGAAGCSPSEAPPPDGPAP